MFEFVEGMDIYITFTFIRVAYNQACPNLITETCLLCQRILRVSTGCYSQSMSHFSLVIPTLTSKFQRICIICSQSFEIQIRIRLTKPQTFSFKMETTWISWLAQTRKVHQESTKSWHSYIFYLACCSCFFRSYKRNSSF